ncbi:MAG: hypothetical protein K8R36_10985 [Planctomycetales bacterium]|nr:hypothetical protein [Planctomycetales bacterium]
MTGNIKWFLAAALAAILLPAAAQAQYPYGGYGFGGYGGWVQMNYGQGYYAETGRVPPYFALHPPVYYSHQIIRRPMGASPFAYPSWYAPPAVQAAAADAAYVAPQPLLVTNPFVKGPAPANASIEQPTSLEVTNPYVAGE